MILFLGGLRFFRGEKIFLGNFKRRASNREAEGDATDVAA
jgi:hypothetical protein